MDQHTKPLIVVGVDGSEPSLAALRWAAWQAQLTGAALHVITAWAYPEEATPFGVVPDLPLPPDQIERVQSKLDEVIAQGLSSWPDVTDVEGRVVRGHAATVLIDASRRADLLVVGHSGRAPIAELSLGSVSERCTRHAECPVVVVRGPRHLRTA